MSGNHPWPAVPPLTVAPPGCLVKRLYFCRHGETPANAARVPQGSGIDQSLSEKGWRQAKALGKRFQDIPVQLVVTSKLKRAIETASCIRASQTTAPAYSENECLNEISWGDYEGSSEESCKRGLATLVQKWEAGYFQEKSPNGESPLEVECRSVPFIYQLLHLPQQHIAIVSKLLRIILASLLHHSLHYMSHYTHHNTCLNIIDVIIAKESRDICWSPVIAPTLLPPHLHSSLDDTTDIPTALPPANDPSIPHTLVKHDDFLTFIPILLDSFEHLTDERDAPAVLLRKAK